MLRSPPRSLFRALSQTDSNLSARQSYVGIVSLLLIPLLRIFVVTRYQRIFAISRSLYVVGRSLDSATVFRSCCAIDRYKSVVSID